ncbi:LysR family transcriptional regulator [Polaromonas sp. A23]|uniref:LysR family transcriptional regulator n=1 Tax=Polaromonas sp. A23 TaxID=1944133 RepID=UPI0009877013|nr:LysR family transcriptional regulator [Polaromonas sp. A23]OOG39108.1 LysR family transcriptional regulator [Polaromonas sp. A23]
MELKDIDLNLLVIFNQLLTERSVSKVAENLGLGQPAVSNALARLRKLFGDELFLRTSSGMQPTPFADQLAESIGYALGMIHGAINVKNSFDPASSKRRFTVGMTDIGEIYFLPLLMEKIQKVAPGVSISTVRNTTVNLKDAMEAGHVDLAIGLLPQLKAGFFQQRLFSQQYVCVFRKNHSLDKRKISSADFFATDHVVIASAGTGHGKVDEILDSGSQKRRIRLTVPHFVAIGHILQSTDMVATVPERLAEKMVTPFNLKYVTHPVKLPQIAINLFWHAKYHKDPANQWLRSLVFDTHSDR